MKDLGPRSAPHRKRDIPHVQRCQPRQYIARTRALKRETRPSIRLICQRRVFRKLG